jgi:hypothetical protein
MRKRVNSYIAKCGGHFQHFIQHAFFSDFNVIHFLTNRTCVRNRLRDFSITLYYKLGNLGIAKQLRFVRSVITYRPDSWMPTFDASYTVMRLQHKKIPFSIASKSARAVERVYWAQNVRFTFFFCLQLLFEKFFP